MGVGGYFMEVSRALLVGFHSGNRFIHYGIDFWNLTNVGLLDQDSATEALDLGFDVFHLGRVATRRLQDTASTNTHFS